MLIFARTSLSFLNFHTRVMTFFSLAFGEQGTWYQPNRGSSAGEQVHLFLMNGYVFERFHS